MLKKIGLSTWIFIGLVLGVVAGIIAHHMIWGELDVSSLNKVIKKAAEKIATEQVWGFKLLSEIFLSLVRVIVAPLVFSLLLVGLVKSGSSSAMGRIGLKTILYFTCATLIALTMGLLIVNLFHPGTSLHVVSEAEKIVDPPKFDAAKFIVHIFPDNIIKAMAANDILPIIVFTLFFAAACAAMKEKSKIIIDFFDAVAHVMLKVTGYVMYFAPLAVFGAVAAIIAVKDWEFSAVM
jgi:Na+/H+-dicarboxylate symporter